MKLILENYMNQVLDISSYSFQVIEFVSIEKPEG